MTKKTILLLVLLFAVIAALLLTAVLLRPAPEEVPKEAPIPEAVTQAPEIAVQPDKPQPDAPAEKNEPVPESQEPEPAVPLDDTLEDEVPPQPQPEADTQEVTDPKEAYSCTISIACDTILQNLDLCDAEKTELIPADGWILQPVTASFEEGESVFDVLQRVCMENRIHMEFSDTPLYNSAYIEGIANFYEFDAGALSGWMYKVNGWFPNYGCSQYLLQDGDVICWVYTCDLGEDVGGSVSQ